MLKIQTTTNLKIVENGLNEMVRRQIPFAASLAINRCAELSKPALQSHMSIVFDRPKPFTLNSIFIKRATKTRLVATVFHSDRVAPYLAPEIKGGLRGAKPFEVNLKGMSGVLVPTRNIKRDSYGGVSKGLLTRILSQAKPLNDRTAEFVIVAPGTSSKLLPGIYQRVKGHIRALMLFKTKAEYHPRYDMEGIVQRVVSSEIDKQFAAAMDYALSTARISAL